MIQPTSNNDNSKSIIFSKEKFFFKKKKKSINKNSTEPEENIPEGKPNKEEILLRKI